MFTEILAAIQSAYLYWVVVFVMLTLLEVALPRERQPLRARAAGLAYWGLLIPAMTIMSTIFAWCWTYFDWVPLLTLPIFAPLAALGTIGTVIGVFLAAALHDFFFYWYHRAQHRWLWRYHATHHAIENLSAVNSYHHVSEAVMALLLLTIPTSLIVADPGPVVPFLGLVLWLHVVYLHSPTRLNVGPLRFLLADNRFHRIHHSLEPRHFDRNFGAFTTLWDRLFGTAYFPDRHEWPAVGIAEVREPQTIGEYVTLPWRYPNAEPDDQPGDASVNRPSESGPLAA